jgi:hypothetical protein
MAVANSSGTGSTGTSAAITKPAGMATRKAGQTSGNPSRFHIETRIPALDSAIITGRSIRTAAPPARKSS